MLNQSSYPNLKSNKICYNDIVKKNTITALGLGSMLLAGSSVLSRILGLLRDALFARIFGSGSEGGLFALDAYYLAFRIPDFLYTLLIVGALSSAFIPLYTRLKKSSEEEANDFVNTTLSALFCLFIALSVLLFFTAPWFLPILAPGFSQETLDIALNLTRLLLLSPILMGMSGIFQGVANVHKRFLGMALAPLFYNLSIILAAVFWAQDYGVYALAGGVLLGALLHLVIQIPSIFGTTYRFQVRRPRLTPALNELFRLGLPRIVGMSAAQVTLFVDFALASLFSLGSLSIYTYALNIQSFPYGVIGVSFALAVFPNLSAQALENDSSHFVQSFRKTFARIWFWTLPAVCGLFFLRDPLIQLFLQGGAFTEQDAALTGNILSVLIWSVLALGFVPLFSRAFYALSDTKTPVLIALLTMLLNTVLSFSLSTFTGLGLMGLALANGVASTFNATVLLIFLSRKMRRSLGDLVPIKNFFHSIGASLIMMLVLLVFAHYASFSAWLELALFAAAGALTYLACFGFKVSQRS